LCIPWRFRNLPEKKGKVLNPSLRGRAKCCIGDVGRIMVQAWLDVFLATHLLRICFWYVWHWIKVEKSNVYIHVFTSSGGEQATTRIVSMVSYSILVLRW
jgi:hypothetical protein